MKKENQIEIAVKQMEKVCYSILEQAQAQRKKDFEIFKEGVELAIKLYPYKHGDELKAEIFDYWKRSLEEIKKIRDRK